MPNNYKDFSQYNEAAEEIRPSARIQLIQRILNAANIISSLASGVPLRWANAYKSFQVLVPNEQGAPTDYTTDNAVSSVDSILHEAESQLRSSQEDMDTLSSELEKFNLDGKIKAKAYASDFRNKWVKFYQTWFCIHFNSIGIPDKLKSLESEWSQIPESQKLDFSDDNIPNCLYVLNIPLTTQNLDTALKVFYTYADDPLQSGVNPAWITSVAFYYLGSNWKIVVETKSIENPNQQYPVKFSFTASETSEIQPDTSMPTPTNKGLLVNANIAVTGSVEPADALGLPDPTDVIGILNNMVD